MDQNINLDKLNPLLDVLNSEEGQLKSLLESLKNVQNEDKLDVILKLFQDNGKLLEKLNSLQNIPSDSLLEFGKFAKEQLDDKVSDVRKITNGLKEIREQAGLNKQFNVWDYNFLLFSACFVLILFMIAFFGLKLYKSLKQKEDKRLEKKIQREQKKKK